MNPNVFIDTGVREKASRIIIPDEIDNTVLRQALDATHAGIAISDARQPDLPLIYVNPAFARMTGYEPAEILGLNCRFLQGDDTLQPELDKIRRALAKGCACEVTLRNYRRDGKLFYNKLSLSPIRTEDGELTHFVGFQKDVTRRVCAEQRLNDRERDLRRLNRELRQATRCDDLTGLLNRRTFDACLDREWRRTLRNGGILTVLMIDLDHFKAVNSRYGHTTGDGCLRRIANVLGQCFGRASDFLARYGGEEFIVLTSGLSPEEAVARGEFLLNAIRAAALPEPVERLTASIGMTTLVPAADHTAHDLVQTVDAALCRAKAAGRDRLEQILLA